MIILAINYIAILNVEYFPKSCPKNYFKEECQEDCKYVENYIEIIKNKFDSFLFALSIISLVISFFATLWSACVVFKTDLGSYVVDEFEFIPFRTRTSRI